MAYTLDEFCAESRAMLKAGPQATALAQISERLGRLLSNPAFVAQTFSEATPPGRRVLYHDPGNRLLCACARAGGEEDREAAQPWGVMGDLRQRPRAY